MPEPNKMPCSEVDALLSDAIEGKLSGAQLASFEAHTLTCATCGPLLGDASAGHHWLKSLQPVEPPADLVANILVATIGLDTARLREKFGESRVSWFDRAQRWAEGWTTPVWAFARQPRFVMSFGMIFFGLSVSLSMSGVKVGDIRQFLETQSKVVA